MHRIPESVDIAWLESEYSVTFPERHRSAISDLSDPIHDKCEFLLLDGPNVLLPIARTNAFIRSEPLYEWRDYLFAFASNGFGDFYVYDTRTLPHPVIYIDPDLDMQESLTPGPERLRFDSFNAWYEWAIQNK